MEAQLPVASKVAFRSLLRASGFEGNSVNEETGEWLRCSETTVVHTKNQYGHSTSSVTKRMDVYFRNVQMEVIMW